MLTNSNISLSNLIVLVTTFSSSFINSNFEIENYLTPQYKMKLEHLDNIADWKNNAFNTSYNYSFHNENTEKINTMILFTKNLLKNSKDIDNEFVDIVNDNFWDLI